MKQFVFGIDVGGTATKIGLFTREGRLVLNREIPTKTEDHGKQILPDIAGTLQWILEEKYLTEREDILGIGLALPGAVLKTKEVKPCVNLDGFGGTDVSDQLAMLTKLPVEVLNDANAAALGEMWQGSGRGCSDLVFVTLGTGIGGGIILGGKLLTGAHGSAGEIGHMKLYGSGRTTEYYEDLENCGCGKKGCAEQFGSATALVRLAEKYGMKGAGLSAKDVMDAAASGTDRAAEKAVHAFAEDLGRTLANVSAVADPEVIVLGGGVSRAGTFLTELIKPVFRKYAFPACEETKIVLAKLESDAGMYGAAKYMLDAV